MITTTATAAAALLTATALRKTYGHGETLVQAVRGIDLTLRPGELVAIMGASGSGKSTLLHILGGLNRPDEGKIEFAGHNLSELTDAALTKLRGEKIGVVFQAYNLMPTLSALDNVALPLLLTGTGKREARRRALEQLEAIGLAQRRNHRPAALSGGEQQRVAVARALVNEPLLVLADEPTGNLDRKNAVAICELLREIVSTENRAVVMVTHEPAVAAFADRIIVLADGLLTDDFPRHVVETVESLGARYLRG